ncbi:MAG: hypothetical protein AB8B40_09655, partial [Prochlorococcus sp.]
LCASEAIKSSELHPTNFKTMTTFNNDYNPELLDQELSTQELVTITGGKGRKPHNKNTVKVWTDKNGIVHHEATFVQTNY